MSKKRGPETLYSDVINDLYIESGLVEKSERRIPADVKLDQKMKKIELTIPEDIPQEAVENFKIANEVYKHETGDYILKIKTGPSRWYMFAA